MISALLYVSVDNLTDPERLLDSYTHEINSADIRISLASNGCLGHKETQT